MLKRKTLQVFSAEHTLLPIDAQIALKEAAAVDPGIPTGGSLARRKAIEDVTEAIKQRYPKLFKEDKS